MAKKHSKKEKLEKDNKAKAEKLAWVLSEWDCASLDQAKELAKSDRELNYALRESGVKL